MPPFSKGNKFSLGNTGGRPPHFETPELLQEQVVAFFEYCVENNEKVTITGLALFLGFESRSSFVDYGKRSAEFSHIIKRARLAVENSYETHGQTIDIFALKNMGWMDKTQQEITGKDGAPVINFIKANLPGD